MKGFMLSDKGRIIYEKVVSCGVDYVSGVILKEYCERDFDLELLYREFKLAALEANVLIEDEMLEIPKFSDDREYLENSIIEMIMAIYKSRKR